MNEILPQPPRPKKYEYRGGTCPKHGNACAMRRCRLTLGPWECVECAHEAGALQALPPASPPAAEPPTPTEEPADPAVEGRGVVCSPVANPAAACPPHCEGCALHKRIFGEASESAPRASEVTPSGGAECKCWHVPPDGKRIANRWCSLHASEWQTLAEQRSELHEDGTPRAGCAVCSSPELDARERGLAR